MSSNIEEIKPLIQKILISKFGDTEKSRIVTCSDRLNFACPICGDSATDSTKKRGNIYFDGLSYHCFNCGYHSNVIGLLKKFNIDSSLTSSLSLPSSHSQQNQKRYEQLQPTNNKSQIFKIADSLAIPFEFLKKKRSLVPLNDPLCPDIIKTYISDRKIPFEKTQNIFYDKHSNRIALLNFSSPGRVVGMQGRVLPGDPSNSKYLTYTLFKLYEKVFNLPPDTIKEKFALKLSEEFDISDISKTLNHIKDISTIFNIFYINTNNPVYVCEGPIDSYFISNCIATCGCSKSSNMFDKLDVRYWYDNDEAGKTKAIQKIKQGKHVFLWYKFLQDMGINNKNIKIKDINDIYLTFPDIKFNPEDYFSNSDIDILNI